MFHISHIAKQKYGLKIQGNSFQGQVTNNSLLLMCSFKGKFILNYNLIWLKNIEASDFNCNAVVKKNKTV